jgi:multicomponent Na+:H+ antiporter subunit C
VGPQPIYLATAVLILAMALVALLLTHHLVRKVIALNVMASAIFLLLVVIAWPADLRPTRADPHGRTTAVATGREPETKSAALRAGESGSGSTDPVPHAMVLTGIVVSFGASALAIGVSRRIHAATGEARLPEERE